MSLIAILDDQVTNRKIFEKLAGSVEEGISVETFANPVQALEWFAGNTPDLVITDYKMPLMDGAEFIRRFRQIPACIDVPVIVITVYEDRTFRLEALEAGATDFLQSPVDHHEFMTRARNLLKLRKQQLIIMSRADELERELEDAERSHAEELRDNRERLAKVIDTIPAMISAADRNGKCVFMNAYLANLLGTTPSNVTGKHIAEMLPEVHGEHSLELDRRVLQTGNAIPNFEEEIVDQNGQRRVLLTTKSPLLNAAGEIECVLTTSLDITDRKRAEGHALYMAHHDTLTDLPNRSFLRDRLRREIARTRRGDRSFALHFLDLDRFKNVNDVLGHSVGDRLLQEVALRLLDTVRQDDVVARLGGDEFAILQSDIARPEDAVDLAQRIIAVVAEPHHIDGHEINSRTSVGITLHPTDGGDVDEVLKHADLAMYRAKTNGGNTYCLFADDMNKLARAAVNLDADLRRALSRKEFLLHYQPQIDLTTGKIVGAEALLRWRHPESGMVRPGDFLPFAEENGLIVPINEWVLEEACREAASWPARGLPPLRVAVNMSPVQFRKQDVHEHVVDVLKKTGLDPSRLELELTENIVMQDADAAARELDKLKQLGVSLSMDDFGTGYSSLNYIKRLPFSRIKIDQCFIRNLEIDSNDAAIVRTIVALGESLGLDILAEGVETVEQMEVLRAIGCGEVQGYYFSRPLPAEDFVALALRQNPHAARETPNAIARPA